jgi:hypothetical protein
VGRADDHSDRLGIFPGERIPGPANDSAPNPAPFGWGIRAYDLGQPQTQQAVQSIMGNVKQWRDNPRSGYDQIEHALGAKDTNHTAIAQLDGQAQRALAWARLIVTQATTLEVARQYAELGRRETAGALAAAQSLQ